MYVLDKPHTVVLPVLGEASLHHNNEVCANVCHVKNRQYSLMSMINLKKKYFTYSDRCDNNISVHYLIYS